MPRAVILTALPVEYLAVRTHLSSLQEEMHPQGTIYERGTFAANSQTWEVGIAEVGAGNAGAAVEAERAIAHFKPDVLLFIGIAGGIKDVAIGDVIAATKVYGYESGKVESQFFPRPTVGQSTYAFVQRAKSEARKGEWLQRIFNGLESQPRVFVAPIAAGEKVIASRESDLYQFLRRSYNDAIAVEMEGFGFLSAAFAYPNIQSIVIRGISDLIEDKNAVDPKEGTEEERQGRASQNASAFAFELLAKLQIQSSQQPASSKPSTAESRMVQNNSGNAQGFQTTVAGGTAYFGNVYFGTSPEGQPPSASPALQGLRKRSLLKPGEVKVFFSYAHEDERLRDKLATHLSTLRRQGIIQEWHDRQIGAGQEWAGEIDRNLEAAHVILLLISADFISSDYCMDRELSHAMERHELGEARVIPIILRPVDWEGLPFSKLQALPTDGNPVTSWSDQDEAFLNVAREIRSVVEGMAENALEPEAKSQVNSESTSLPPEGNQPFQEPQHPNSENVTEPQARPLSFFALDDRWVGRTNLIQDLSRRIHESCRLLILVGMTGIGKTALGERLAVELEGWLDGDWLHFHQENFDDEQQPSDFASVAARWLEKWGEMITPDDRKDPQRLLYRLINHLRENCYLVQMDSLENILQGNEEEGWNDFKDEWWIKFFESYLKADTCQSCVILTSQDLPGQIEAIGTRSQNFWYCQPLSGLEKPEQIALFKKIELDVSPNSEGRAYLERIGAAYEGHPLALRVIAGEIKNKPFEGNVVAYWSRYGNEVEEVEKAIAEAQEGKSTGGNDKWKLDRFTKTLRRNVRSRLDKTFARLKEDAKWAYIMLCEASVYRCPVPEEFWLSHLEDWERNEEEQKSALNMLRERFLVEEILENNRVSLKQHNLIRSISLEHLKHLE